MLYFPFFSGVYLFSFEAKCFATKVNGMSGVYLKRLVFQVRILKYNPGRLNKIKCCFREKKMLNLFVVL